MTIKERKTILGIDISIGDKELEPDIDRVIDVTVAEEYYESLHQGEKMPRSMIVATSDEVILFPPQQPDSSAKEVLRKEAVTRAGIILKEGFIGKKIIWEETH